MDMDEFKEDIDSIREQLKDMEYAVSRGYSLIIVFIFKKTCISTLAPSICNLCALRCP
jgi:hypothetical protein